MGTGPARAVERVPPSGRGCARHDARLSAQQHHQPNAHGGVHHQSVDQGGTEAVGGARDRQVAQAGLAASS
jgi:hypothetical protein